MGVAFIGVATFFGVAAFFFGVAAFFFGVAAFFLPSLFGFIAEGGFGEDFIGEEAGGFIAEGDLTGDFIGMETGRSSSARADLVPLLGLCKGVFARFGVRIGVSASKSGDGLTPRFLDGEPSAAAAARAFGDGFDLGVAAFVFGVASSLHFEFFACSAFGGLGLATGRSAIAQPEEVTTTPPTFGMPKSSPVLLRTRRSTAKERPSELMRHACRAAPKEMSRQSSSSGFASQSPLLENHFDSTSPPVFNSIQPFLVLPS